MEIRIKKIRKKKIKIEKEKGEYIIKKEDKIWIKKKMII